MTWVTTGYRTATKAVIRTATNTVNRTSRRSFATLLAAALLTVSAPTLLHAQDHAPGQGDKIVTVAAAADMEPVFQVLGPIFEQKTGLKLKVSYASSATLSQQLQNGFPADIFFSADFYFAEQLVASHLTEGTTPTAYAQGLLVLWTRNGSRFKPLTLDDLARKDLGPVAVANPDRAPYGRAAIAAIKTMKLYANVAPHIVEAESVGQAAQFALSGNAELALISQTIAMSPKYRNEGNFVLFPFSQYPPIVQNAVILKNGANREGAHALLKYMLSTSVQTNLTKLGLKSVK